MQKSKRKGVSIKPINFENYKVTVKGNGVMELSDLAALYEWSKESLRQQAHQLDFLFTYHPDSHRFWLKGRFDKPDEDGAYRICIDLEDFIESSYKKKQSSRIKAIGSYIPDNYELARKVMADFRKLSAKNKKFKFEDHAYRECANWYTKDVEAAKALADYIQKKYVEPSLNHVMKINNIKECKFSKTKNRETLDFIYKK